MIITSISLALFVVVGTLYYIFGDRLDQSKMARNLDLSVEGLFKALGIFTVCIGLMSIMPTDLGKGLSMAEAFSDDGEERHFGGHHHHGDHEDQAAVAERKEALATQVASTSGTYTDGVFQGVGYGFKGDITTEVEIVNGEIIRVEVVDHRDDRKWFNWANRALPQNIIDAQSADVDVVSGATYTSLGIIEGVSEALNSSRGE